ncbi:MAG: S9 family peptidase [Chloroflexi bacterium]|nr:S9 family peptidase [Chloroflexota bacterium]
MSRETAAYGSWKSPITSDLIVAGSIRLGEIQLDGEAVYWLEGRPSENGRNALVKWTPDGGLEEMSPAGFNVRTRVHEYGGGSFAIFDDTVYFSNFVNQRVYVQYPFTEPEPLTTDQPLRFADGVIDPSRGRMICVREAHLTPGEEAANSLVSLNLDDSDEMGETLAAGHDFYASPTLSPDAEKVAWISWDHPNMPWEGTELWVGELDAAGTAVHNQTQIAGGRHESIFQPVWSPDGSLYFASDRSNWWNLYCYRDGQIEPVYPLEAEFGVPQWLFRFSTYGFADAHTIICSYTQNGRWYLARLDVNTGELVNYDIPFTEINYVNVGEGFVIFLGGAPTRPSAIVKMDIASGEWQVLKQATNLTIDPAYLSMPRSIEFPIENGLTSHAFYYPPQNRDYEAPDGETPPLLVVSHGGPTSATKTSLNVGYQYWTSRGFAVVDVNYGGSTGYGRDYRQRLNGQWGIVDVADCTNAALYLVEKGLADRQRLAIRGSSAGGYTTLCALTFHNTFTAGASHFGVSDLEALAKETHKFESRYLDSMVGPYPKQRQVYHERSPLHAVDQINCPLILFQGLEDKVVSSSQAETMFTAVKQKGIPVAYVPFAGEQHGFRRAENIKRALDGELYFYSQVFNFNLTDPIPPIQIENL